MGFSNIMDSNSYSGGLATDPDTERLIEARAHLLGPAYRLFYERPVHLVRGSGSHLFDADGGRYLDAYNNVVSVGHCHPRVVAAITRQAETLNTHTRYLHHGIVEAGPDQLYTNLAKVGRAPVGQLDERTASEVQAEVEPFVEPAEQCQHSQQQGDAERDVPHTHEVNGT